MHIEAIQTARRYFTTIEINHVLENEQGLILPNGMSSFIFNFKPSSPGSPKGFVLENIFFSGLMTDKFESTLQIGDLYIIFQMVAPFSTHVINEDASKMLNRLNPLSSINDTLFQRLAIINSGPSPVGLARAIERNMLNILDFMSETLFEKAHLIRPFFTSDPGLSVDMLAYESSVSIRTLERYFKNSMGITPKMYQRMIRFYSTLRFMKEHPDVPQTETALMFGFYDQSHMINEFQKFYHFSPNEILQPV